MDFFHIAVSLGPVPPVPATNVPDDFRILINSEIDCLDKIWKANFSMRGAYVGIPVGQEFLLINYMGRGASGRCHCHLSENELVIVRMFFSFSFFNFGSSPYHFDFITNYHYFISIIYHLWVFDCHLFSPFSSFSPTFLTLWYKIVFSLINFSNNLSTLIPVDTRL